MRGYFLDTCVLSGWYKKDEAILARVEALPDVPLWISVAAWGEVEYGFRVLTPPEYHPCAEATFKRFVREKVVRIQDITTHTVESYGKLKALLFSKFAPGKKKRAGLRPEQLVDPVTSLELGIQENDLWMAAQAMQFNFVLATVDKMHRISEVAQGLVTIENWLQ